MKSFIKNNLLIAGGGIIGITIAREAALSKKFSEIIVLEKDLKLGSHSSTRNSGVIHAGFYYTPESIKAKFCSEGNKLMRDYCIRNKIESNRCGKVVVSKNDTDDKNIYDLYKRGIDNGCELEILEKKNLNKYEPLACTNNQFLWSPNTWSISPDDLFNCLVKECEELGIKFIKGEKIIFADNKKLKTAKNNIYFYDYFINACGGYSLEVAKLFGIKVNYQILPFKGLYLKSKNKITNFSTHIYPVPDNKQPFLGIHTTLTKDNYLKLGPTAIPVFSPENYSLFKGLEFNITKDIFILQFNLFSKNIFGFRDLAFREIKYLLKENILKKANELTIFNLKDLEFNWHSPGIRPQLYDNEKNILENDFILKQHENSLHILNTISPAWTTSFINAKYVINKLIQSIHN